MTRHHRARHNPSWVSLQTALASSPAWRQQTHIHAGRGSWRMAWRETAMRWQELLAYCLAKPGAWQDEPWEGDVVVKIGSKIFAFFGSAQASAGGLKCGVSPGGGKERPVGLPRG